MGKLGAIDRTALAAIALMVGLRWGSVVGRAEAATTQRVSVSSAGVQGNCGSFQAAVSADGRFVAFSSCADNLVGGDTNRASDVFVRDRTTGQTQPISVSSTGAQGNSDSFEPAISAGGRYVVFISWASNLVGGDTNGHLDVFVRDRQADTTELVSVSATGTQGNQDSLDPSISADGRYVVFGSYASNLVAGDTNGVQDVYIRDLLSGTTHRLSVRGVTATGVQAIHGGSFNAAISADGRYVAYASNATNLVPGDTNHVADIFLRDRTTGKTRRVSISSTGGQGNFPSSFPAISADDRFVVFQSLASTLVSADTNRTTDVFIRNLVRRRTRRVSISTRGGQGNRGSDLARISGHGRFVVFESGASNLVSGDTNAHVDIFIRDRGAHTTKRLSYSASGKQANGRSDQPVISTDGRIVGFYSSASNLVAGDTNGFPDVFVRGPLF